MITIKLATVCPQYQVTTISLTIFLMLYIITFPWLIYFLIGCLYLLVPFTYLPPCTTAHPHVPLPPPSLPLPLWQPHVCSLWVCFPLVLFFCFLNSTCKWEITWLFVFLCLIYFIASRSIYVFANGKISFF